MSVAVSVGRIAAVDARVKWGNADNLTELRALNKAKVGYCRTEGYATPGDGGAAFYYYDAADTTTADDGFLCIVATDGARWKLNHNGRLNVKQAGATGDGSTDDHAAIQAAADAFKTLAATTPATLEFPAGRYLISAGVDFSDTGGERRQIVGGDGFEVAEILADFDGYGSGATDPAAFMFGDEASPAYQSIVSVSGFHFSKGPSCTRAPVGILAAGWAQSRLNNITFGSWNNNTVRLVSPQNTRFRDVTMFSGGLAFEYKDASAVTVQQSGTTLTADGAIFDAGDVGHVVGIWGTGGSTVRRKATIVAYTSATEVELDTSHTDGAARELHFGSPLVSITSGTASLTADAPCFTADHVGLYVWVKRAGASGALLRSKIAAYVSATQVTLADNAGATISGEEFTVPAVDIYSGSIGGGSDNTFTNFQVENHSGVGVCVQDQDILSFVATKIHGEQSAVSDRYSIATLWADRIQGHYQGSFDAQYLGEHRAYFVNQTSVFNIESLTTRTAYDEQLFQIDARATTFEGGLLQIDDIAISGANPNNADIENLIVDANSDPAGYVLTGRVSFSEYDATVQYSGNKNPGEYDKTLTGTDWNGTAPSGGSEKYRWSRLGDLVVFEMRMDYASAGASNSVLTIPLPASMPVPKLMPDSASGELIGPLDGMMSTDVTGATAPALTKCYWRGDGAGGHEIILRLNSSTIAAKFAAIRGTYFAKR